MKKSNRVALSFGFGALSLFASPLAAHAATGVCDANPPTSTQACISAIQNAGGSVVNDIFTDINGLSATELPLFGVLFNQWPGCDRPNSAGCAGTSLSPFTCPGQYTCSPAANTLAAAGAQLNALDRLWWQPCRVTDHTLDVNGCPNLTACVADGTPGNYNPWEGLVFDLGGPSNKVAIFAQNDHGPQPCESLEYTVFLSDNPFAKEVILDPKTDGVDPNKWNRAVLTTVYTKGWVEVRPPDPATFGAACGDTAEYSVEEDSFAQVFSLPCGITFKYTSIVAGNDGLDFPECGFDSNEAELDAVAGLTESGAAVCPDNDGDHYVDCNCVGAPLDCDCDDSDPEIHPGALEACDSPDLNCDNVPGSCSGALVCYESVCVPKCTGVEDPICPVGSTCELTDDGRICIPKDCTTGGCPPGGVCSSRGVCVPACTDVTCPGNQICQDGTCLNPCGAVTCPAGQSCHGGICQSPCNCFADDIGCTAPEVCDRGGSDLCVPPACKGVVCGPDETCDPATGACVELCNPNVTCPVGQKCVAPTGCVPLCDGVTCSNGEECDPTTGKCVDHSCDGITCFPPLVCVAGSCVDGSSASGTGGGKSSGSAAGGGGADGSPTGTGGSGGGLGGIVDDGSCGCHVVGDNAKTGFAALGLLGLASLLLRRARRSVR